MCSSPLGAGEKARGISGPELPVGTGGATAQSLPSLAPSPLRKADESLL